MLRGMQTLLTNSELTFELKKLFQFHNFTMQKLTNSWFLHSQAPNHRWISTPFAAFANKMWSKLKSFSLEMKKQKFTFMLQFYEQQQLHLQPRVLRWGICDMFLFSRLEEMSEKAQSINFQHNARDTLHVLLCFYLPLWLSPHNCSSKLCDVECDLIWQDDMDDEGPLIKLTSALEITQETWFCAENISKHERSASSIRGLGEGRQALSVSDYTVDRFKSGNRGRN
jgi:hypothetical protein